MWYVVALSLFSKNGKKPLDISYASRYDVFHKGRYFR